MSIDPELLRQYIKPLDLENDPHDRACEKYRKRMHGIMLRALKDGGADELVASFAGSFVGLAQGLLGHGAAPSELADHLHHFVDFAVAQATNGAVISSDFVTKYGQGGSA